jgi:hypothetical protein
MKTQIIGILLLGMLAFGCTTMTVYGPEVGFLRMSSNSNKIAEHIRNITNAEKCYNTEQDPTGYGGDAIEYKCEFQGNEVAYYQLEGCCVWNDYGMLRGNGREYDIREFLWSLDNMTKYPYYPQS